MSVGDQFEQAGGQVRIVEGLPQRRAELRVQRLLHVLGGDRVEHLGPFQRGFELLLNVISQVHRGNNRDHEHGQQHVPKG